MRHKKQGFKFKTYSRYKKIKLIIKLEMERINEVSKNFKNLPKIFNNNKSPY